MASLHSLRPVALALGLVLAGCNQGSQNDPPVSYTHLRAHET